MGSYEVMTQLDKLMASRDDSQTIGDFVEWLHSKQLFICEPYGVHGDHTRTRKTIEELLAEYFEIDLVAVENEQRAILNNFRRGE